MIRIKIEKENTIQSVSIKGHAMYADFGKDIVCASVSSIVTTTVNGLLKLNEMSITYEVKEGLIQVKKCIQDETTDILLQNMLDLFEELEKEYPKNIKIEEVSL